MHFYTSAFFWALISMLGLQAATVAVGGHRIGRRLAAVATILTLITAGRVVLALPFCAQPRLDGSVWQRALGAAILLGSLGVLASALKVKWWRPPSPGMKLQTGGLYSIVRHPIYLGEVIWPIGWSLLWGSTYGLALTPLWWLMFLLLSLAEEEQLSRVLGDAYSEYKARVRGRIFPGLPV